MRAQAAYERFLELWREADPKLKPELVLAREALARRAAANRPKVLYLNGAGMVLSVGRSRPRGVYLAWPRKVRAPQGRPPGNAWAHPATGATDSATENRPPMAPVARGSGKGEKVCGLAIGCNWVRAHRAPGNRRGMVNPGWSKAE